MQVTISGTITDIFPAETKGDFTKRIFWVKESSGEYPQHYQLESHKAMVERLDSFKAGDVVDCKCDLRGKQWTNREGKTSVFNSITCFGINKVGAGTSMQRQNTAPISATNHNIMDDLPF